MSPEPWGSNIAKDATVLAEPPSSPFTSPHPLPLGNLGSLAYKPSGRRAPGPRVSYAKAKIQVYCGRRAPAYRLPVIRWTHCNPARGGGSAPGHLLDSGCSAAEALIN